jgi:hypothetical protein
MVASGMDSTITDALAARVQRHLDDEERTLTALLAAVRQLHESLRYVDGEALTEALRSETEALREAERLRPQRQQIRDAAARELGFAPQEFTLGLLVQKTAGNLRAAIAASRQKLTGMSAEMDRLNRLNAAMIQQSLMLIRGTVERLTGTAASGESYGADGSRDETHAGPLVHWGG